MHNNHRFLKCSLFLIGFTVDLSINKVQSLALSSSVILLNCALISVSNSIPVLPVQALIFL